METSLSPQRDIAVTELLRILGDSGLRLATAPSAIRLPLTSPTFFDAQLPPEGRRAGILLGIGINPANPRSVDIIRDAARHGFGAVVIKALSAEVATVTAVAEAEGIALIVADDEIEWRNLDTLINSGLTSVTDAGASLSTLVVGDLFALANAIAAMVGGATTIEDMQEHVLAYSTLPKQEIDDGRREGILGLKVPQVPFNNDQYVTIFRAPGAVHFPPLVTATAKALPRLAVAVRAGTQPLGSIWVVDATGNLHDDAERALERAADIAALHLLRARSASYLARQQRVELLRRVMEGTADAHLVVEQLNLDAEGPFVVVAFQPDFPPGGDELRMSRLVDLIALHCEAHQHGAECVVIGNTVYSLFAGTASTDNFAIESTVRQLVARAASALQLSVQPSIGSVVESASQVGRSRRDAELLLLMVAGKSILGAIPSARNAKSQLTLLELAQVFRDTPRLTSEHARKIIDCDNRSGTEYAKTIRTFLDCARDSAVAAARLSLHQNSLRYRLKRIKERFGIDLDNPDDTLMLWLSLRVTEFD